MAVEIKGPEIHPFQEKARIVPRQVADLDHGLGRTLSFRDEEAIECTIHDMSTKLKVWTHLG